MKLYNTLTTSRDLVINKSPVVWGHTTAYNLPTHTSTKQTRTEQQSLGRICITSMHKYSKKELEMMLVKREHVSDFTVSSWPKNQWDGVLKKTRTFLFFFQSTKGSLKHKVSLSFDLDHTSAIGNLILFGREGLDGSTLLALALQNPMTDLEKSFCFSIRQSAQNDLLMKTYS